MICTEEITTIEILFDTVISYRSADEGSRIDFLKKCSNGFLGEKIIIKVINSNYVSWFMDECYSIHDEGELNHYMILTTDNIVDVLTYEKPQISILSIK